MNTLSNSHLFPKPPTVDFQPEDTVCPNCKVQLQVQKTRERSVTTLHIGTFNAHETVMICAGCNQVYYSEELQQLVPFGACIGYDVMVFVGKALFLRHRNTQDVLHELTEKNIFISASEVAYLGKRFIVYLSLAHQQSADNIRTAMNRHGGYILHLDATTEGGSPFLMTTVDSITDIVLGSVKIPSENAKDITLFLQDIQRRFGDPVSIVTDMGRGILKAISVVFKNILHFICHFHFIRDIGKDLLEDEYNIIRKRLRHHGITAKLRRRLGKLKKVIDADPVLVESFRQGIGDGVLPEVAIEQCPVIVAYTLINWAFDGKKQGQGYGFPFDRPHVDFLKRLFALDKHLEKIQGVYLRGNRKDNVPLCHLYREINPLVKDQDLKQSLKMIESKIETFEKLRNAMRIAPQEGKQGLNEDGLDEDIHTIKNRVQLFCDDIRSNLELSKSKDAYNAMLTQIDKYGEKLFADPIVVQTPQGEITIQAQRTNNIMERFFRDLRKGYRKKTGHNSLNKTLQAMLADTLLVKNLNNEEYMTILLQDKKSLEDVFADIDINAVRNEWTQAHDNPEKIPKTIKRLISKPDFLNKMETLFLKKTG